MAKKTFTLSANVENGIAEGSRYIVTPNVQKVLQEIVDGYQTGIHSFSIIGTYGTGKTSFLLHLERDLLVTTEHRELLRNPQLLYDGSFEILNILGDSKPLTSLLLGKLQEVMPSDETDALVLLKAYYAKLKKKNKFLLIAI